MANRIFLRQQGGDVSVIISNGRRYQLDSGILRNASPVLEELLSNDCAATLSSKSIKQGIKTRFCLLAVPNEEPLPDLQYVLTPIPLDDVGRPSVRLPISHRSEAAHSIPQELLAFEAVFAAFYARPIDCGQDDGDGDVDVDDDPSSTGLGMAHDIVKVAEYLDCVALISPMIEAPLLAQGQDLYRTIGDMPVQWLSFANRLRSKSLFREALIHAAGRFNDPVVQDALANVQIDAKIKALVKKKAQIVIEKVRAAFLKSISYYPQSLQRERHEGRADKDTIGRESYAKDIMTWLALLVLRQWLSQQLIMDTTHHAEDMGFCTVQAILAGGDEYLSARDVEAFHQLFPTSAKARNVLFAHLTNMKVHIKTFFTDLMKSESHLMTTGTEINYFLCTTVEPRDFIFLRRSDRSDAYEGLFVSQDPNDEE